MVFFYSDRMTGHSGAYPVWVVSQDAENSDTTDYVKFTKPFEKDTGKELTVC